MPARSSPVGGLSAPPLGTAARARTVQVARGGCRYRLTPCTVMNTAERSPALVRQVPYGTTRLPPGLGSRDADISQSAVVQAGQLPAFAVDGDSQRRVIQEPPGRSVQSGQPYRRKPDTHDIHRSRSSARAAHPSFIRRWAAVRTNARPFGSRRRTDRRIADASRSLRSFRECIYRRRIDRGDSSGTECHEMLNCRNLVDNIPIRVRNLGRPSPTISAYA